MRIFGALRKTYTICLFCAVLMTKPTEAQKLTLLYPFKGGTDGRFPNSLVRNSVGEFYGTTQDGGDLSCGSGYGCGTVFRLRGHKKTTLYAFTGGLDGGSPNGLLLELMPSVGNVTLYGVTREGGTFGNGTLYRVDANGRFAVLHNFEEEDPSGGLVRDADGNLYGVTEGGGGACDCGVVFMLSRNGEYSILHKFTGVPDGEDPSEGLVLDNVGNVFGTAEFGGDPTCRLFEGGCGIIFKLSKTGEETILHAFTGQDGGDPGDYGIVVPRIMDSAGNLYGTTPYGGEGSGTCGGPCGTLYKLDTSGNLTILHTFRGGSDGGIPQSAIVRDQEGNLYGTTEGDGPGGDGVIFKFDNAGHFTLLYSFDNGGRGVQADGLIRDPMGNLYGFAHPYFVGAPGAIFKFAP